MGSSIMYNAYCMAVDSSIRLTKKEYLFSYKGTEFKLVPNLKYSDALLVSLKNDSEEKMFEKASEFFSLVAFKYDAKIMIHPGGKLQTAVPLCDVHVFSHQKREIVTQEFMEALYLVPYVDKPEQSEIVRIYRQATASNNVYLKFLFYWHTLVYPMSNDGAAVKWVNKILKAKIGDADIKLAKEALRGIKMKDGMSVGNFLKHEVRDAIGHIKRADRSKFHILLDNVNHMREMWSIVSFAKSLSRYRIRKEFNLESYPNEKKYYYFIRY